MPTRAQLERLADQAARDKARHLELAAEAGEQERALRELAKQVTANEGLHKRLQSATVNDRMHADHRLAISKGHKDDAWTKALRASGFSQNSLARAVGVNQAVLSLHRQKLRKIPMSRAKAIEAKTGWPADARHWPCGIVSDGE